MYHNKALGWIRGKSGGSELLEMLRNNGFPVTDRYGKPVVLFDYIVLNRYYDDAISLLDALSSLSIGGLLVLELHSDRKNYKPVYKSMFANFTGTVVKYGDNMYLVIHNGADYGN